MVPKFFKTAIRLSRVMTRQQFPSQISLDDDCGVPRNRDESSGVANLIILVSPASSALARVHHMLSRL